MASLTYKGRLPGVVCAAALPRREAPPLRLDVAGFVGFAERGPLDTPVRVEDISQYRAIFGGDLLVAREEGVPIYAHLPRAVQSFFDNGGQRCYVVRVAQAGDEPGAGARPNHFQMPGMISWDGTHMRRVVAPAAWVGRWSDRVSVGTQLFRTPLRLPARPDIYRPALPESVTFDLEVPSLTTVQSGDVLWLHFADGTRLMLRAATVAALEELETRTLHDIPVSVTARSLLAFNGAVAAPPTPPGMVERLGAEAWQTLPAALAALEAETDGFAISLPEDVTIQVDDILRLNYAGTTLLFPVARVDWDYDAATEVRSQRAFSRQPLQPIDPTAISGELIQVDYLSFDLLIREGNQMLETWPGLRFGNWTTRLADDSLTADDLGSRSLRLGAPPLANFFPLGMEQLPFFNRPLPDDNKSGKDGLDSFDPAALFLDPAFQGYGRRTLMRRAEELLYLSSPAQKLLKLHSLLPLDEVALITIPDLAHRPWLPPEPLAEKPPPEPEPEPEPLDWSRFRDCPSEPPPPEPSCAEPALDLAFAPDELFPENFAQQLALVPVMVRSSDYTHEHLAQLMHVQEALIELCAARADAVAILSMPQHFARRELVDWQQQLTGIPAFRDGRPLSYAAAYHGWIQVRELATPEVHPLRNVPPDGAVCGMIAAREAQRGAWVAPANQSLRGVVGLVPTFDEHDEVALFEQQINLIQQQPGRFTPMSAHTLSSDHLFWQLSVRRLLILLRKLVLRQGDHYVFEPNDMRFRRRIQRGFERRLGTLLENGALTAFHVVTGEAVNTRNDYDNGRLIIEIKVAPSHPIEFISVMLLRSGESLLHVIER